ncbi:MAG: hypothetical protein E5X49_32080 [Mesorhizobium sp.]|nr:MAG: hypothetical protein EOQ28_32385 [Mesorhizobium sp.]RWB93650.1 MAG: hypothetical protein EOQ57_33760 [Mesorhizobium sp.]RWG76758.1 MAG: hypothetical protein EOQ69_30840 [Mesorhizobium sp.]RWG76807.1 MAG: hypothetical protein EOQ70_33045 [Mesorhizobium sp.]RWJ96771.1 MAG: hypothetical protein EOR42_29740 [Mesorhizobium sp.]
MRFPCRRSALLPLVSPIASLAGRAPTLRPAPFSPFTGRRCRQADEGRRRSRQLACNANHRSNCSRQKDFHNPSSNRLRKRFDGSMVSPDPPQSGRETHSREERLAALRKSRHADNG